jgi:regulator of protease activity HflC (stomatin/prohibitin superfamily)
MNTLLTTTAIVAGGLLLATGVTSPWIIQGFAQEKLIFTVPEQNTVEAIAGGGPRGRFIRFTSLPPGLKYKGEGSNWDRWEIIKDDTPPEPKTGLLNSFTESQSLQLVGWPGLNAVYEYPFRYGKVVKSVSADGTPYTEIEYRTGTSNFVYITEVPYGIIVPRADTKDGYPIRVELVVMLRITNPYRALYGVTDYLTTIEGFIAEVVKDYIGSFNFEGDLWTEQTSSHRSGKLTEMITENVMPGESKTLKELIQEQYGVKFCDIFVSDIEPADEQDREDAKRVGRAKIEADAREEEARGKAAETIALGEAEVEILEKRAEIMATPSGMRAAELETLREIGKAGNTIVTDGKGTLEGAAYSELVKGKGEKS